MEGNWFLYYFYWQIKYGVFWNDVSIFLYVNLKMLMFCDEWSLKLKTQCKMFTFIFTPHFLHKLCSPSSLLDHLNWFAAFFIFVRRTFPSCRDWKDFQMLVYHLQRRIGISSSTISDPRHPNFLSLLCLNKHFTLQLCIHSIFCSFLWDFTAD